MTSVSDLPGCRQISLPCHSDARGRLYPLDLRGLAGFDASRLFIITVPDDPTGIRRAGHANSTPEVLIVMAGRVTVDLDSGADLVTQVLDRPGIALLVGPGVLIHLREFAPGTVLLGLAETPYAESRQFSAPEPALFAVQAASA